MDTNIDTNNYYTFMYCMIHDDGFIIQGNHDYVPYGYVMQHSQNCEFCDWYNMGVIAVSNDDNDHNDNKDDNKHNDNNNINNIKIIKSVRLNYDRYDGRFIFRLYLNTLTDDKGNSIEFDNDDDCILYKWIGHIHDSINYTHTITTDFLEP